MLFIPFARVIPSNLTSIYKDKYSFETLNRITRIPKVPLNVSGHFGAYIVSTVEVSQNIMSSIIFFNEKLHTLFIKGQTETLDALLSKNLNYS